MNLFIGVGNIVDVYESGKVLKFSLAVKQEKPCYVTCVLFEPDDELKEFISQLAQKNQLVWLQGRAASYEFESHGRTIRKLEIVPYRNSIRPL